MESEASLELLIYVVNEHEATKVNESIMQTRLSPFAVMAVRNFRTRVPRESWDTGSRHGPHG